MAQRPIDKRERPPDSVNPYAVLVVTLPAIALYAAVFAIAMQRFTYDYWGAVWLAPVLVAVSVPILLRHARGEADSYIGRLLVAALLLKLIAAFVRFFLTTGLYERADFNRYGGTATALRDAFLAGDFSLLQLGTDRRTGTQFIELVTGVIYTIIGPSLIGTFLFFSWLSFWGLYFFYRAFRIAIPDGDARRYGLLLFFLPSMLFWPSSIGKEAWMTFVLGMAVYGSARLLTRQRGASLYLTLGLAGILAVRPHMALLVVAGLGLSYMLRGLSPQRVVSMGKIRTLFGLGVIGVITLLVTRQVSQFFGIDEFNLDAASATLEEVERRTSTGGSDFTGTGPSLSNLPLNIVTVLFRPFIFEAHNIQALMTAVEGVVLMLLFVLALPRLRSVPKRIVKQPYIAYCLTYVILFCFIFSSFQNFGNLVRQRVLVFPLVLVFLALPYIEARRPKGRRAGLYKAASQLGDQSDTGVKV
jgi:hypothetical protein